MALSGLSSANTTTGASGNYSFANLAAGSYTVTPSLSGYTFTPGSWSGSISSNTTVNFTASPTGGGTCPDLVLKNVQISGTVANGNTFTVKFIVNNQGTADAGPFTVKAAFSVDQNIGSVGKYPNDTLLFTASFTGLAAGASTPTQSLPAVFSGFPIHGTYYVVIKVDADDQVAECNETNNKVALSKFLYR
jgi:hypothetical protein